MPHLGCLVAENVPLVLEHELPPFPHLHKEHGPNGHEGSKDDCAQVVEQQTEPGDPALILVVPEVAFNVTDGTHVEGVVRRGSHGHGGVADKRILASWLSTCISTACVGVRVYVRVRLCGNVSVDEH